MIIRTLPGCPRRRLSAQTLRMLPLSFLLLGLAQTGCRGQDQAGESQALTGVISIQQGEAEFTPCHTRTRVPVSDLGDQPALVAAYQQWRSRPGEPLLVTLTGRIAVPPGAGPQQQTPHLIVDRFDGIWPGETCGRPEAVAQLRDMYWRLTRLEGQPVMVGKGRAEPHLVLHSDGERLTGSGGCNRLQGSYELQDDRLVFGRIGVTRMYCPEVQDQEQAFLTALERVAGWRLDGQHLELLDEEGAVLLRLEERPLTQ